MQGCFCPYFQMGFQCSVRMLCVHGRKEPPALASMPVDFYHKSVADVFLSYQASANSSAWKVHLFSDNRFEYNIMARVVII